MRVVSVLPSATEIVCALGGRDELVGRSEECDHPEGVRSLPVVMRARTLDRDRPSGEIDARVQSVRSRSESLYELDLDLLRSLRTDLILTQDLCGVCSVTDDEVRSACRQAGVSPRVLSLAPTRLDGVWDSVDLIGAALGRSDEARRLSASLRERSRPSPKGGADRPVVAVVEWLDPPILAGLWSPEIVERAGGQPLGPTPGTPGRRATWEQLVEARPDLVILSPCSFSVARTRTEAGRPPVGPRLSELARAAPVWIADEAYFSRPGPRLADGVELVRGLLDGRDPRGPMPVERFRDALASRSGE